MFWHKIFFPPLMYFVMSVHHRPFLYLYLLQNKLTNIRDYTNLKQELYNTTSSIDNLCVLYGSFHAVTLSAVALDSNQMAKIFLV